ncbi:M14 family zinc carboxypeptidase [Nocardioides sp. Kera G14]|uniref:M14 family zinc carboxypeptidase n=1 Tax=Nocardioides sp. Kera G14 TaxID=2884264 RepID=UPI001D12655E|nr:M14 family zinc carboxypeptidase [Nocardioides sp. Kera G14]UDY22835.1 DUF2817 domain-containing protein [Nocardioides sp. Kera G14]
MRSLGIALLLLGLLVVPGVAPAQATTAQVEVIGHSVEGRPLRAIHLGGSPGSGPTVVLVAAMHGDETAPTRILASLRRGGAITGADVWIVPTLNPDGRARHRRWNAHGVDLNRNYPASWRRMTGRYNSGSRAGSEPETQAMMAFLRRVRPDAVVSFHQPLDGVDRLTKSQALAKRLARALGLKRKTFSCHGGCHGNLTQWFNASFPGTAVTVELGAHPTTRYLTKVAPRALLGVFGARR